MLIKVHKLVSYLVSLSVDLLITVQILVWTSAHQSPIFMKKTIFVYRNVLCRHYLLIQLQEQEHVDQVVLKDCGLNLNQEGVCLSVSLGILVEIQQIYVPKHVLVVNMQIKLLDFVKLHVLDLL